MEGPFIQRQGWQIRGEDFHYERLESSVETMRQYPSDKTICALVYHGGSWDMDHL
jgi:hypothetical protein